MFGNSKKEREAWARRFRRILDDASRIVDPKLRAYYRRALFAAAQNADQAAIDQLEKSIQTILSHGKSVWGQMVGMVHESAVAAGHSVPPKQAMIEAAEARWQAFALLRRGLIVNAARRLIALARRIVFEETMRGGDDPERIKVEIEARLRRNADAAASAAALTETHAAAIEAQRAGVDATGLPIVAKQWAATNDHRTRPTHREANGQKVGMDDLFEVGGWPMKQPGDSSYGAPPSEVVNCRCGVIYEVGQ